MGDYEDIQRLIRLKRHEKPPEEFVDQFMHSFQQRQRAELLNRSARGLLWERMATYFEGMMAPKLAWGAAAAVVVGLGIFALNQPQGGGAQSLTASHKTPAPASANVASFDATAGMPITDEEVAEYLLSRHYDGLFNGRDSKKSLQSPSVDSPQFAQPFHSDVGNLLPVGFTLEMPR